MNTTLTLGDLLVIVSLVLAIARWPSARPPQPGPQALRTQRQLDAIMKHLGLPEPASGPGALSAEVLAMLAAGNKIGAIKRYRQETAAGLKEAKDAVEWHSAA